MSIHESIGKGISTLGEFLPTFGLSALFGALGGGGDGGGQERQGFAGDVDPQDLLGETVGGMRDLRGDLTTRANRGVQLRSPTVAQTPGSIRGGSLPFEIGLSGTDPAGFDPSLLSRPGLDFRAPGEAPRAPTPFTGPTPFAPGGGLTREEVIAENDERIRQQEFIADEFEGTDPGDEDLEAAGFDFDLEEEELEPTVTDQLSSALRSPVPQGGTGEGAFAALEQLLKPRRPRDDQGFG